ncbi:hypothetical protein ATI61_108104 [Archangium gephyra]|uniref:Uncharacterized protein n=1 Tax=Archangium gephyra TaxID=48 RepID=A0AAC8Q7K6_9BACT|nr:hypothetical protein [Archangium gephyra]AKJ02508.1 Hypothetical protein AA314_04134 [Archangium gephyra]REG28571.1 hypothetical protein ATI61_108104 [Archangium gephyra]
MDEKKKPETSWEERTQLGPYQLEEQVPQPADSPGELYRARHEESGATALVLKPAAEEDVALLKDWRVRIISSITPSYIAMEVEDSRWSVAPDKHSVEALVFLLEGVRAGVRRMTRALSDADEPRLRWRLGLALAGTAVVCTLFFAWVRLAEEPQASSDQESATLTPPALMSHEEPTGSGNPDQPTHGGLVDTADAGEFVLARPLPREPFKGQKRPPCTRYAEVELVGACWLPHKLKAPCPDVLYEHQGECYSPAFSARPPPQSLGQ